MENQTLTIKPLPKQYEAYQALKDKDQIFFGGGAGGGKSWWICESRIINAISYPGYKSFIGREELKRLMSSTYLTFVKVANFLKIPQTEWKLNGQYNYIEFKNGSRIDLLDLKYLPSDPFYERFGSLEYTDGAIEEAGEVDFRAYDVLKSRVGRHMNEVFKLRPSLAMTGNPKKNWTYKIFYKPWVDKRLPENFAFIQSLYEDNFHTARSYGQQLAMISDPVMRQRLKDGIWEYDDPSGVLMTYDAINDIFSNTIEESNEKYMTVDVARYGQDTTVIMLWSGLKVWHIEQYAKQGVDTTASRVKELARDFQIPYSHIIVDDDGVGGGVTDICRGVKGFNANSVPLEIRGVHQDLKKQNYKNLKAQCTFILADRVENHMLAITASPDQQRMIVEELEQIKQKDPDSDGKLAIVPKDEIKAILNRSPDFADALMMRMWFFLKEGAEISAEDRRIQSIVEQTFDKFSPL